MRQASVWQPGFERSALPAHVQHMFSAYGVLLVGAEPAPSPFSKHFNPRAIPRIRGSQEELDKWLGEFDKYPGRRFASDGQPDTVTVREGSDEGLNPDRVGDLTVRSYAVPTPALP